MSEGDQTTSVSIPSLILSPSVTPRMITPNGGDVAHRRSSRLRARIPESSPEEPETTLRTGNLPPEDEDDGDRFYSPRPASYESSGTDTIHPSPRSDAKPPLPRENPREIERVSFAASPARDFDKRATSIMRSPRTPRTPRTPRSPGRGNGEGWHTKVSHIDMAVRRQIASQLLSRCQDLRDVAGCRAVWTAWKNECDLGKFYSNMIRIADVRRKRRRLARTFNEWGQIMCQTRHLLMVHSSLISKTEFNLVTRAMEAWCEIKLRLDRFSHLIWKASLACLRETFTGWSDRAARIARFRRQMWMMNEKIKERMLFAIFNAWRDACGNCDVMSLDVLEAILIRKRIPSLLPVLHAWYEYVSRQRILERVAHNCSHRWGKMLLRQTFWEWSFVSIDRDQDRVWTVKADKKRTRSLALQYVRMWYANARKSRLQQSRLVRERHKLQLRALRWVIETMVSNALRNRQLRASLTSVVDRHVRRMQSGVLRGWYGGLFDLRMASRSEHIKRTNETRRMTLFLRIWSDRHVFWKRVQAVCAQLLARHKRELRSLCLAAWKAQSDLYWSRWRRRGKVERNHETLLVSAAFCRWVVGAASHTREQEQAVVEREGLREVRRADLAFGEWAWVVWLANAVARRYAAAQAMAAVGALRAWSDMAVQAGARDHRLVQLERRSAAGAMRRAFEVWGEVPEYYGRLSEALHALLRRVERRGAAVSFYAWQWSAERARRRQVIFRQMWARLAFFSKLGCFHAWRTRLEDGPGRVVGVGALSRRHEAGALLRALGAWRGAAAFRVRAERIIRGFRYRNDLQHIVLKAWQESHRVRWRIKVHGLHWNRKDGERALQGWREATRRGAAVKELCREAGWRGVRVLLASWARAVDLRRSMRLRGALMRLRLRREAVSLLRAFSALCGHVQRRAQMAQVGRYIARRAGQRVVAALLRTWREEALVERRYANALNKFGNWWVHNLKRWGLQRWKQWLDHKWRTQNAFSRVMDEI